MGEANSGSQSPRPERGCRPDNALIMVTDPLTNVPGESDIVLVWPGDRDNDVDEVHDGFAWSSNLIHNIFMLWQCAIIKRLDEGFFGRDTDGG